jgi:hypothetical protein
LIVAPSPTGRGDLRGAAERLERGIEKYAVGDLVGALADFEEAIRLYPASARGREYAEWVRDLSSGKRAIEGQRDGLDEDALQAVSDALDATQPPPPERARKPTPPPPPVSVRERRPTPPPVDGHDESPWDPVPLTPTGHHEPSPALRPGDAAAQGANSTSATSLAMPPLEPRVLVPSQKRRGRALANDGDLESVTREFRSTTPTAQNLPPLDVPELTDEQIQGLLSFDATPAAEGRTSPEFELDRIDSLDDGRGERLLDLDAMPELPAPKGRKNDTTPMGVASFIGDPADFDQQSLTPTGVKPAGLRPVRTSQPGDDPYGDVSAQSLELVPDLRSSDEAEESGTDPTNPFIRGPRLAQYTSYGSDSDAHELAMSEPGMTAAAAATPLAAAETALASGKVAAAVDACELALAAAGGIDGELALEAQPLVEQIYAAILRGPDRIPVHGNATPDLDPRSAFLLSRIDGALTVEDVLDVSGMPRLEALRTMALLVRRGAVVVK